MSKRSLILITLVLIVALLAGCSGQGGEEAATEGETDLKVGIVLSSGGKGDMSFNDSALRGLDQAKEEGLIADYEYIEPKKVAEVESNLRFLAKNNYDLVIGVGFMQEDEIEKVSQEFPDTKFAIVDAVVENDNVSSLVFAEHEGSFLAGAFAALMTTHDEIEGINDQQVVGFVGGMDMPLIHKFELGYTSGVEYINETQDREVEVKTAYTGSSPDAFNDPAKGQEIALAQYDAGADIIYHAAGGTGMGVFKAAESTEHYAIGVDSDQDWVEPGYILTSMQKRVDNAVFNTVQAVKDGTFEAGVNVYGLETGGIALTPLDGLGPMTKKAEETGEIEAEKVEKIQAAKDNIPPKVKKEIKEIKEKIIAGEITVPNYMEENN